MSTKRKLFAGLASLTLFDIAAASAADMTVRMPVKAPAPPSAIHNWAGFYVGAHAGYRWADAQFTSSEYDFGDPVPARNDSFRPNGGIFGAHLGYNIMLSPTSLAGIEGDWTWGSGRDTVSGFHLLLPPTDGLAFVSQVKLTWQATIRGRLGVVSGPWLFYATAGVAFVHVKWSDTVTFILSGSPLLTDGWALSKTKAGWTVGGGIEHMLGPNWLVRVEYLYEDFGSFNVPHGITVEPQIGKLELDAHKLRVGISYKFGGGPVVARY